MQIKCRPQTLPELMTSCREAMEAVVPALEWLIDFGDVIEEVISRGNHELTVYQYACDSGIANRAGIACI